MTPDKPPSIMQHVLSRYTAGSPLSLMVRIGLEHCFSSAALDEVFEGSRTKTYTNELAFSATVDLLGLVVTGGQPSVRAAYPHGEVGVTLKAVYEKLQNVEPAVSAAMVRGTADRAAMLIRSMKGTSAVAVGVSGDGARWQPSRGDRSSPGRASGKRGRSAAGPLAGGLRARPGTGAGGGSLRGRPRSRAADPAASPADGIARRLLDLRSELARGRSSGASSSDTARS
ncbi:MAG: hypothetical protein IPN17_11200 [Deltaproteobacteria bacterium]|nr:hypothetical protein [Deltaproteobacteria bacterium]